MRRLRPRNRSPIWLTLYSIGLVCVLSFVFFEMLDVDGSDFDMQNFKTLTTPVRAGLHRATTEAGRRVVPQRVTLAWLSITIDQRSVTALSADRSRLTPAAVVVGDTNRIALPRASLETAPPA